MNNQDYYCQIPVDVNAEYAFSGIKRVADWWTSSFTGQLQKINDDFKVSFGDTFVVFRVTELAPNKKMTWLVTDSNLPGFTNKKEWNDTSVVWEIESTGEVAKINMTHTGLNPQIECYDTCSKGWNFYVKESLQQLLNKGKGRPDTPGAAR